MRNNNSQTVSALRPSNDKQLNYSVWELYRPKGVPAVEVILFHGLQMSDYGDAFWKTWLSRDEKVIWPAAWLGPDPRSGNARIVSISYDSSARSTECSGVTEMYLIIENLVQDIVLSSQFKIDENCKVILVGHSLGGLIIKQLLLKCNAALGLLDPHSSDAKRIKKFLCCCSSILYYSTPHMGSELPAFAAHADHTPGSEVNMPIIKFLQVLSSETSRINDNFRKFRSTHLPELPIRAISELHETKFGTLTKKVVPEASARQDVDVYYTAAANHFEVCRAENNTFSNIFLWLRELCEEAVSEAEREEAYVRDLREVNAPTVAPRGPSQQPQLLRR